MSLSDKPRRCLAAALGSSLALFAACSGSDPTPGGGVLDGGAGSPPFGGGQTGGSSRATGTGAGGTAGASTSAGPGAAGGSASGTGGGIPAHSEPGEPIAIHDCGPDNAAGFDAATVDLLRAGGDAGAMRYLYPYDGTVFPRGILAPELMWEGAEGSGVYLHIKSSLFDYEGCLPVASPGQVELPLEVWHRAGEQTLGPSDPFTLELTVWSGSAALGPISEQIVIAQATLKGSIYYNSYVGADTSDLTDLTSLLGGGFGFGGSIYRIPPEQPAEVFLGAAVGSVGCFGCHTVSANGERMISHTGGGAGGFGGGVPAAGALGGASGASYGLTPMGQPNPPVLASAPLAGFTGMSPDGSVYIGGAHPAGVVRPGGTPDEMALVNDATLYETDTGTAIPGSGIVPGAMMPTFSADGTLVVFNDIAVAGGRGLAAMDWDPATRTASGHRVLYTDADRYPGWPFVLPDAQAVVFARGVATNFTGGGAGVIPGTGVIGPESDLHIVDLDTGASTILARAMGMNGPGDATGYTPFGAADLHKHYYPTVSPVAAGGYFWLFFDSIRNYGNRGSHRQLWGTAIAISPDGDYSVDRSHPAFYLPGQGFGSGNHRAFAALDACVETGAECTSSIDCCGGSCYFGEEEFAIGHCQETPPNVCSNVDDRCETHADCCVGATTLTCINGFCATVPLI